MATHVRFSFLTAGPKFGVELPDDFDALPELSSPLTINNGFGARSFDFVPAVRDTGVQEPHRLLRTLVDRYGNTVELYERLDPPPQWYLRWLLGNGVLYTHLREEEGPAWAEREVESLDVVADSDGGAPFLLPEPPLGRGASMAPGYQEFASFRSRGHAGWAVVLQRPGYLRRGNVMRAPDDSKVVLRGGAAHGIEATVLAPGEPQRASEVMSRILGSLAAA